MTAPDGTVYKELFHTTADWKKGLTHRTEVHAGGVLKKYTTTEWTQDNTALTYQNNPRPTDLSVYDEEADGAAAHRSATRRPHSLICRAWSRSMRRTPPPWCGAPRRLTARTLPTSTAASSDCRNAKFVKEGNGTLRQKLDYHYDWDSEYMVGQEPAMGHDAYSSGFIIGRGNLVGIRRFNVSAPGDDESSDLAGGLRLQQLGVGRLSDGWRAS
ncbi:MAG: hypothetical protein WKF84_24825 [Pyrinomonadaceae bacterium]